VVGISRDQTFQDPSTPSGLPFSLSVPMVIEAQAMMTATVGSTFAGGYVQFHRLAETDPVYPGVRVRYHLQTGQAAGQTYTLTIRTKGTMGAAPAQDVTSNPIFVGAFSGRLGGVDEVGLVGDGVVLTSDSYGVLNGEFIDRSLWLNDYNSIVGRLMALMASSNPNSNTALAVGVIGRSVDSGHHRDYPSTVVSNAECVTGAGVITLSQSNPSANVVITHGITATGAFGVAPHGDIFTTNAGDYLFSGSTTRNLGAGCTTAPSGALGDFPAPGSTAFSGMSLSGQDSIIGRTLFISADGTYAQGAPGGSPYSFTQSRQASCVVGLSTETAPNPTGSGVHYLPSVYTAQPPVIPGLSGVLSGSSSLTVSMTLLLLVTLVAFFGARF